MTSNSVEPAMESGKAVCSPMLSELIRIVSSPARERKLSRTSTNVPRTSRQRLHQSLPNRPISDPVDHTSHSGTVLYLAYGSNLSAETFRGSRGIKPLSELNVVVPELVMTFDLPGIPYSEPCFANTARRDDPKTLLHPTPSSEKHSTTHRSDYHKNRWHKGLVGVVYEVTKADYAHIIATEGGGSGYHDILVDAYPLPDDDPSAAVPEHPNTTPFKCHTLFAPVGESRVARPDPAWAQPSPRYLKLITDGADEHDFPTEYKEYLHGCRTYTPTGARQRMGQFVFLSVWVPIIMALFAGAKMFADEDGRYPPWLVKVSSSIFRGVWGSYDGFFKPLFGEGERTLADEGKDGRRSEGRKLLRKKRPVYGTVDSEKYAGIV